MRRLIRVLIVAGVAWAIWALLRELLDQPTRHDEAEPAATPSATSERNGASGNGTRPATKAELYREAQRLGVEGRSKMTKEELAAAVATARSTP